MLHFSLSLSQNLWTRERAKEKQRISLSSVLRWQCRETSKKRILVSTESKLRSVSFQIFPRKVTSSSVFFVLFMEVLCFCLFVTCSDSSGRKLVFLGFSQKRNLFLGCFLPRKCRFLRLNSLKSLLADNIIFDLE